MKSSGSFLALYCSLRRLAMSLSIDACMVLALSGQLLMQAQQ